MKGVFQFILTTGSNECSIKLKIYKYKKYKAQNIDKFVCVSRRIAFSVSSNLYKIVRTKRSTIS